MRTSTPGAPFARLLRGYRQRRGLTQEELAERAELSVRAVRNLELGRVSRPRPATVRLLARALRVSAEEEEQLAAAAREPRLGAMPVPLPANRVVATTGCSLYDPKALALLLQHATGGGSDVAVRAQPAPAPNRRSMAFTLTVSLADPEPDVARAC